jgi:hypothetical protein
MCAAWGTGERRGTAVGMCGGAAWGAVQRRGAAVGMLLGAARRAVPSGRRRSGGGALPRVLVEQMIRYERMNWDVCWFSHVWN